MLEAAKQACKNAKKQYKILKENGNATNEEIIKAKEIYLKYKDVYKTLKEATSTTESKKKKQKKKKKRKRSHSNTEEVSNNDNTMNHHGKKIKKSSPIPSISINSDDFKTKHQIDIQSNEESIRSIKPFLTFNNIVEFQPFQSNWTTAVGENANPTPIQAQSWPIVLQGHDTICVSRTGSGKTFGFLLPLFYQLIKENGKILNEPQKQYDAPSPSAVILAPTRELAIQIHKEALRFGKDQGIRSVVIYGGAPKHNQINSLKGGANAFPHLITCTPGRLLDFVTNRKVLVDQVLFLVLDEADRMLDMGFSHQLKQIITHFDDNDDVGRKRQTLFFSATFPPFVHKIAKSFLKENPIHIYIGGRGSNNNNINNDDSNNNNNNNGSTNQYERVLVVNENVKQKIHVLKSSDEKPALLRKILTKLYSSNNIKNNDKVQKYKMIIFLRRKKTCDVLADEYANLARNDNFSLIKCESLHGDKHQVDRIDIINKFKRSDINILFATDVVARGIDIQDITHIINYDFPLQRGQGGIEEYVHRVGRTGRAGKKGKSITFFTPEEAESANDFISLLESRGVKQKIPSELYDLVPKKEDIEEAILKREAKRERKKKSKEVREGDWKCPMCGANVFASKNECFKCGASRVW